MRNLVLEEAGPSGLLTVGTLDGHPNLQKALYYWLVKCPQTVSNAFMVQINMAENIVTQPPTRLQNESKTLRTCTNSWFFRV